MRRLHEAAGIFGLLIVLMVGFGCDNAFKTITVKIGYKTADDGLSIEVPAGDLVRLDGDVDLDGYEGEYDLSEVDIAGEAALDIPPCQEDAARLCVNALPHLFEVNLSKSGSGKSVDLSKYESKVKGIYISSLAYSVVPNKDGEFALTGLLPPLRIFLSPQLQMPAGQSDTISYHDWNSETQETMATWNLCGKDPVLPENLRLVHLGDTGQIQYSLDIPDLFENFPSKEHYVERDLLNAKAISDVLRSPKFTFKVLAVPCGKAQLLPADQAKIKEQLANSGGKNPRLRMQLHMNVVLATQL